ncbi:glycosyltransferase, partial [Microbacterium sp. Bi128]|uniref:glycosyltransferase n=1 Tax=Microbacterium sp. Bi128 TaxID=2821115 RepID=UPI001E5874ED
MAPRATVAVAYDCLFPYSTGGGERQYRAFADAIGTAGLDVDYLTSVQWDGPVPAEERFRIVPVSARLSLYTADGVRRIPAALRYATGLFRELRRRRSRYAAVIVSGLPIFNVFAARLALWGSGTRLVVDYLEVWHRRQWVEYSGAVTGTIAWILQRAAIAMTPLATCHSQLSASRLRREGLRSAPLVSP